MKAATAVRSRAIGPLSQIHDVAFIALFTQLLFTRVKEKLFNQERKVRLS